MTYTDWFPGFDGGSMKQPTADLEVDNKTGIAITQDCIELRKLYGSSLANRHYFSDEVCSVVQPYICETKSKHL